MQDTYPLDESDRLLQKTQSSFDVSVREIFWPLIVGARLVLAAPGRHGEPSYLEALIEREQLTIIHFVPSMLQLFLDETDPERCRSLRCVLSGGEALPRDLVRRFFGRFDCELHNLYGPTEAAVSVTTWQCRADDEAPVVPLGRPIANTQLYVVDSRLELVPVGVWGELLIGGAQVARGYHERPELTADRFVRNPFGAGRVYRTGDLARWNAAGVLEFGGRIDNQVKLRGFRVELGEIESVLREHASVVESAVVAVESAGGRSELAAYIVLDPACSDEADARADLLAFQREKLPDYMVPSSVTFVERLPLLPSGKLDRNALPAPDRSARAGRVRGTRYGVRAVDCEALERAAGRRAGRQERQLLRPGRPFAAGSATGRTREQAVRRRLAALLVHAGADDRSARAGAEHGHPRARARAASAHCTSGRSRVFVRTGAVLVRRPGDRKQRRVQHSVRRTSARRPPGRSPRARALGDRAPARDPEDAFRGGGLPARCRSSNRRDRSN